VRPPIAAAPAGTRLSDRQMRQLWARVRETQNFWESLKEVEPGAVARLAEVATTNAWDILFITTRPSCAGDPTQRQSQRWLRKHGFVMPSVFVVSGSRGRVATALTLDVVIDDRPENCLDVATDSKAKPILVWRDDPETAPPGAHRLGITVVHSIAQALQELETPAAPAQQPGLLKRLKGALGA
jgi:hypothetical protein